MRKIRVVDVLHEADGAPVVRDGQPCRVTTSYRFKDKVYRPGDVIEMSDAEAKDELRTLGTMRDATGRTGRCGLLEPLEVYEEREAEKAQREAARRKPDDEDGIGLMQKQLEESVLQRKKIEQMVVERDRRHLEDQAAAQAREERARAEVPPDMAERLARLEREAREREEDARRRHQETAQRHAEQLKATEARAAQEKAEAERRATEERQAREKAEAAAARQKAEAEARAAKAEEAAKAQAAEMERLRKELADARAAPVPAPAGSSGPPKRPG